MLSTLFFAWIIHPIQAGVVIGSDKTWGKKPFEERRGRVKSLLITRVFLYSCDGHPVVTIHGHYVTIWN